MTPSRPWTHLSPDRIGLFLRTVFWLSAVRLGLWVFPFRTVLSFAHRVVHPARTNVTDSADVARVCRAVRRVARYVPFATCLTQSLAVIVLLGRLGVTTRVVLGVRKTPEGRLLAHAWVERAGTPLFSTEELAAYTLLPDLPSTDRNNSRNGRRT